MASWRVAVLFASILFAVGCDQGMVSKVAPTAGGQTPTAPAAATVLITPGSETIRASGQRQFNAFDFSVGQHDVTWALQEGASAGTVDQTGFYTAPGVHGTFHLVATSIANPKFSATAPITVASIGFVSITGTVPRSRHSASLLSDGRVLIAGGTSDATHSAELFNPAQNTFTVTHGTMLQLRSGHSAALLQDGRILIVGGDDGNGTVFPTTELFDPATETFVSTGALNYARTKATATLLQSGRVLIAGGQDSSGALLSSAELYDPATGSFSLTGNLQMPRAEHTATLLGNGTVLLVGSNQDTASAEIFNPATGSFTTTGSLVQARTHHTATLLPNGKVLVLGGTHTIPPIGGGMPAPFSLQSAEVYDPSAGAFQAAGKLLTARDAHSATLLANGTVLVEGGYVHDFDGDAQSEWYTIFSAELFNPSTGVSTPAASLESDRAGHLATSLNNGQILVTGGITGFQELCCSPNPVLSTVSSDELYKRTRRSLVQQIGTPSNTSLHPKTGSWLVRCQGRRTQNCRRIY